MGLEQEAGWFEDFCSRLRECVSCSYSETRAAVVCPEGPVDASVVFIGEAPGSVEDREGRPFVGMAGRKLVSQLDQVGLDRSWVYITNRAKCRPIPHGRPSEECLAGCDRWLREELELLRPRVVVALGNTALRFFRPYASVTRLHGEPQSMLTAYGSYVLLPLYHPAHCVYQGDKLRGMTTDINILQEFISLRREEWSTYSPRM